MNLIKLIMAIFMSSPVPEYTIEYENETYQIIVKYDGTNPDEIKKAMMKEAEKSSLMGMAFVNKVAGENNAPAKQIASLYEGYRRFFVVRDKKLLLQTCQSILSDPNTDNFVREMASYIQNILENKKTTQSDGKNFIKNLIPSLKQTLLSARPTIVSAERIVKIPEMKAIHNAFPDLIKYDNYYYACFREGRSHGGYQDFGKIRILRGQYFKETDTWQWENVALLANEPYDLRDPKFYLDSQNQLHLILDGSYINEKDITEKMVPHIARQINEEWKVEEAKADASANGEKGQWIWRITWNPLDRAGYGFSYGKNDILSLMKTTDGITYKKIADVSTNKLKGEELTEGTIRFKSDGSAVALIRTQKHGLIGTSGPDSRYTKWSFNVIPFRLGGPNFVFSENEKAMWVGTRHFFINPDNTLDEATVIASMDEKQLVPLLRLRSNLDNSYPGLVLEDDGSMTVLYYSGEPEGKSDIYITRVNLP